MPKTGGLMMVLLLCVAALAVADGGASPILSNGLVHDAFKAFEKGASNALDAISPVTGWMFDALSRFLAEVNQWMIAQFIRAGFA